MRAELERRRRQLAAVPTPDDDIGTRRVLVVEVGRERYGLPIEHVAGILRLTTLAPLPGLPAHVVGLSHQHGEVVGVIDIRAFFGVERPDLTDLPLAVVVRRDSHAGDGSLPGQLAILVDVVDRIEVLQPGGMHDPISTHTGMQEDYQLGTTPDGCLVLDLAHILDDPRLVIDLAH
ncbi:MAG: chemotaxis protein CheW [Planctomycetota bacterium]